LAIEQDIFVVKTYSQIIEIIFIHQVKTIVIGSATIFQKTLIIGTLTIPNLKHREHNEKLYPKTPRLEPDITFELYCFTSGAYAAAARVKMQSQQEPKLRPNISLAAETTRRVVAINNLKYSSGARGMQKLVSCVADAC
jgi:hypothetical protein